MVLVLASQSPRRRELMGLVCPRFEVDEACVEEKTVVANTPKELAGALANVKAKAVFARRPNDVIIACDTVVDVDGKPLGKPKEEEEIIKMICCLAGRSHFVHTGVSVYMPTKNCPALYFTETTQVTFDNIPEVEIAAYAKGKEALDKAGAYAIQGWAARYVSKIEGCYYNVMGLPVAALYKGLLQLGVIG